MELGLPDNELGDEGDSLSEAESTEELAYFAMHTRLNSAASAEGNGVCLKRHESPRVHLPATNRWQNPVLRRRTSGTSSTSVAGPAG